MARIQHVDEMSLLIKVFVELERLQVSLEDLREALVMEPKKVPEELYEAPRHCRRIMHELKMIRSMMHRFRMVFDVPAPAPPPPPKGPPNLKLAG